MGTWFRGEGRTPRVWEQGMFSRISGQATSKAPGPLVEGSSLVISRGGFMDSSSLRFVDKTRAIPRRLVARQLDYVIMGLRTTGEL